MRVCIVGLGHIGLPSACIIARAGYQVIGVDKNLDIVEQLRTGQLHVSDEPGIGELINNLLDTGQLRVEDVPEPADVFMIAVQTPYLVRRLQSRHADLSYIKAALESICPYIRRDNLVILESTVPPGTTMNVVRGLIEERVGLHCGKEVHLVHAPERVLPGRIAWEFVHNDRIVGGVDPVSTSYAVEFYRTFIRGNVLGTDAITAEVVKLMENTYRGVNIALANEFALLCEHIGVNVFECISLANRHPRVDILSPGPGVGGHCIPVDPYFLIEAAPEAAALISVSCKLNSSMPAHVVELILRATIENQLTRKIALLGVSYKADIGDERGSPALEIANILRQKGYEIALHDPHIPTYARTPLMEVLSGCDVLALTTDHSAYRAMLQPSCLRQTMRQPYLVDTRGFFGVEWDREGFTVIRLGVGRTSS